MLHTQHARRFMPLIGSVLWLNGLPLAQADTDCTQVTEIPQIECEALLDLYHSTNGPNWKWNTAGWNMTNSPCNWNRVSCDEGHVTRLNLGPTTYLFPYPAPGLSGPIPESLGNLNRLTWLNLSGNKFSGPIPDFLGNLNNLTRLDLSHNQFSVPIPDSIEQMSAKVNLSGNPLPNTNCAEVTEIPQIECEALLDLYHSTNGPLWKNGFRWNMTNRPCYWFGISCHDGHVIGLSFASQFASEDDISGLNPESLENLSHLTGLDLSSKRTQRTDS
jgi:Leucine-rich repeat (LRR) protein